MTGLALLCFMGRGELSESREFGSAVKTGIDWLLKRGSENDARLCMAKEFNTVGVYEHGIATYALAEYYAFSKDDRVKHLLTQAVAYIVNGQAPDGGWQYSYAKGPDSDTSVSGWQIQALKAAHLTDLKLAGVEAALNKAMLNLKRVQDKSGNFGYRKAGDRGTNPSLAGVGVFCNLLWPPVKSGSVREGVDFLLERTQKD